MKLLVVDIETTGLDINSDAIIEIGAALVDTETGEINLVFDKPVKGKFWDPKLHKDAWIFGKSNLTFKDVEEAQPLEVYFDELQALITEYNTVAFNLSFDKRFLTRDGFTFNKTKCLMESVKKYVVFKNENDRTVKPSVEEIYNYFLVEDDNKYVEQHRAGSDAIDEAKIMLHMIKLNTSGDFIRKIVSKTPKAKDNTKPKFTKKYEIIDANSEFPFGKYKGSIFSDIVKKDKRYLTWCLENVNGLTLTDEAKVLLAN